MADENLPPQSVEDSYAEVNRKLTEKLEELKLTALGAAAEADLQPYADEAEAADMRPVGDLPTPSSSWNDEDPWAAFDEHEPAVAPTTSAPADSDSDWDDAHMRPVSNTGSAGSWSGSGFVPDDEPATWDDADAGVGELGAIGSVPGGHGGSPYEDPYTAPVSSSSWEPQAPLLPSEEEVQFWAQTRTALRLLQQSADHMPSQVAGDVSRRVEEVVREELDAPSLAIRQVQQSLPNAVERIERALAEELEVPVAVVRQLQEELPMQLERVERTVQGSLDQATIDLTERLTRDLSRFGSEVTESVEQLGRTMQTDVSQVEQTVATNVTRMAQGLSSQVSRIERGVQEGFDRVERTLHGDLGRVEEVLRDELDAPLQTVRQLQEEMPLRFSKLERTVQESSSTAAIEQLQEELGQLRTAHRQLGDVLRQDLEPTRRHVRELVEMDLGSAMGELATAGKVTIDRLGSVSDDLGRDRLQRVEDLELLIDSMTKGWQGVYGAMGKLLERVEHVDTRVERFESKLGEMRSLEDSVEQTLANVQSQLESNLAEMQRHLQELQPAPVVVTVNHPDASIQHTTKGGYTSGQKTSKAFGKDSTGDVS